MIVDDGSRYSYAELKTLSAQFAAALRARDVQPGDRVMVQVKKSPATIGIYLACLQIGAIFLPLNTGYTDAEVAYFVNDAKPTLFVHEPDAYADEVPSVVLGPGLHEGLWQEAAKAEPDFATTACASSDMAAVCYTSGTTGKSKGAMISHGNLSSNATALIDLWQINAQDVLLHILPIFHVHGLFVAMNTALVSGATILFERDFNMERVLTLLPTATLMMGVPTHYTRLLGQEEFDMETTTTMRLFLSGSAPMLAETHRNFEARTGHRILERYGMTEAGMITSNPYGGERVAGTVGYPLPGVSVRVRTEDGTPCAAGETGVLEIRGPNVFTGYWEMPEKTAETFTEDGWMITGDLVTEDGDGRITIVGRAKDLIISGGYNVYPKEIELIIDDVPGVLESAVIGMLDPDFGEAVVAVIVLDAKSEVKQADLDQAFQKDLARFKHPQTVHYVEALPRNAMGKVQKAELRERFSA